MGPVYAEIELINSGDLGMVKRGYMDKDDVKRIWVNALVDKRTYMLCINEKIKEQLQLPVLDQRKAQIATGEIVSCDVVGPVDIRFKNRESTLRAMVLPGDSEVLLGAIPLEDMDVLIHPLRQELIVNPEHPYFAQMKLK
ncbi:MAG: hypothetical protein K2Q22_05130 [Cytophagales bacterium]|nr:hypothetical protein [Cytophagales bacterium]